MFVRSVNISTKRLQHGHGSMVATASSAVQWRPPIVIVSIDARGICTRSERSDERVAHRHGQHKSDNSGSKQYR